MNPELPKNPREEQELRVTALLLGELSDAEAAAVREAMAKNPELTKLHDDLKKTIHLVRAAATEATEPAAQANPPLTLSEGRREKLLASFKTVPLAKATPAQGRRVEFTLVEIAAVLAIIALFAAMLLPALSPAKERARSAVVLNNLRQLEMAKAQWALDNQKSAEDVPTFDDIRPYMGRGDEDLPVAGEEYVLGKVGESPVAYRNGGKIIRLPEEMQLARRGAPRHETELPTFGDDSPWQNSSSASFKSQPDQTAGPVQSVNTVGFVNGSSMDILPTTPAPNEVLLEVTRGRGERWSDSSRNSRMLSEDVTAVSTPQPLARAPQIVLPPVPERPPATPPEDMLVTSFRYATSRDGLTRGGADVNESERQWGFEQEGLNRAGESEPLFNKPADASDSFGGNLAWGRNSDFATAEKAWSVGSSLRGFYEDNSKDGKLTEADSESFGFQMAGANSVASGAIESASDSVADGRSRLIDNRQQAGGGFGGGGVGGAGGVMTDRVIAGKAEVAQLGDVQDLGRFYRSEELSELSTVAKERVVTPPISSVRTQTAQAETGEAKKLPENIHLGGRFDSGNGRGSITSNGQVMEFAGYDDPGAFVIQAGNSRTPMTAGVPVPRFRVRPAPTAPDEGQRLFETELALAPDVADKPSAEQQIETASIETAQPRRELEIAERDASGSTPLPTLEAMEIRKRVLAGGEAQVLEEARLRDQESESKTLAYYNKKQELEQLVREHAALTAKILSQKTDEALPKSSGIVVVKPAEPTPPQKSLWGRITGQTGEAEATATIKVHSTSNDIQRMSGPSTLAYGMHFVPTQVEIIESEAVLGKVVEMLDADGDRASGQNAAGKLNKENAIKWLKEKIEVQPVKNTDLLDIRAKSNDPAEAAKIANAVAHAYKEYSVLQRRDMTLAAVRDIEEQFSAKDAEVRRAQQEVERLQAELGVEERDLSARKPSTNAPIPQPEILTSANRFSTFSLNVSDVSFKLAAASLEQGQLPDPASIRSEEFINAFDYRDPEPTGGAPIAFAWERARYPFAHNRDLLRFSLKTAATGRQAGRPLNIVLLLDNSGSMERADRVSIIREALRVLSSQLQPQDRLSVVLFARTARLVADGIPGDKAGEVAEQISGLTPQGGTNLEDAMRLAYETAARHYLVNGINRVVLLTDGAANLGNVEPESLKQNVEAARQQGIALDCFGIGWEGLNDDLLEVLSRNGDGRYGFINSPEEAATDFAGQLAGALKVAASDVKVQVEFNPRRIASYRQIGYAKHQLTQEQFRDNTVDAAEIAAQEAGNALYTVEVNPAGAGPLCTVRVRYKVPGTTVYCEHSWDVPYTGSAVALEQASTAMRLAATASAFSEWLAVSPYADEVTPDALLGELSGVPEVFGADSRPTKLEWMIRQAKSIEGK